MKTTSLRDGATRLADTGDGVLVDPEWLHDHLSDPRVRVVEVDVSPAAYNDWHIDGATLWNVYADLKDADYRLVDTAALQRLVTSSGRHEPDAAESSTCGIASRALARPVTNVIPFVYISSSGSEGCSPK